MVCEDEVVIASFERFSAKVFGRKIEPLDARSHRAIVNEYALIESFKVW